MPFLRAALIKRTIQQEPEELVEAVNAEEDIREPESLSAPEEITDNTEDIHTVEDASDSDNVPEIQEEEQEEQDEQKSEEPEQEPVIEPVPEEELQEPEEQEAEIEPEPEPEQPKQGKDYSGATLDYDFTSGERYVDTVSTKTEFDKMLDELAAISGDLLSHEAEKFAVKFTGKFQGDNDKSEADAKKYEAFLGGYITNAAMLLYDNGYRDAAIKRLDQAKSILEARKKLEDETEAIKTRVEEQDDSVDLSDILGLFGD